MAPPVKLKQSSSSATKQTIATSSQDARLLVRETMRISANLASAPSAPSPTSIVSTIPPTVSRTAVSNPSITQSEFVDSSFRLICCEEVDGRRWNYFAEDVGGGVGSVVYSRNSIRAVSLQSPQAPIEEIYGGIISSLCVSGKLFSHHYHFFGGAISVFTTQTLLNSVRVCGNNAATGAVAINWILKLRFAGDILMELGAGVELVTAAVPHLFLPLACAANVAKNIAAVTSTSTRAPIYKAFAKGENIGDVTAKGKCVGNIADLLGTGLSIMVSKQNLPLLSTFAFLSRGYVLSSYQEVRSLVLHTLNRAGFTVAVESFLKTGQVPALEEGNIKETVFSMPWLKDRPVVLGSRFKEAFQDPAPYFASEPFFAKERYVVTHNPEKHQVYALLKDQAKSDDIIKAAFHGHVLLHSIHSAMKSCHARDANGGLDSVAMPVDIEAHVADSCKLVAATYGLFEHKAAEKGWVMSDSLLNPGRARIVS